jgi:hypothetical protein
LPFHLWYKWLEKKFKDLHELHVLENDRRSEEIRQWQRQQEQDKKSETQKHIKKEEYTPSSYSPFSVFDRICKYVQKTELKDDKE